MEGGTSQWRSLPTEEKAVNLSLHRRRGEGDGAQTLDRSVGRWKGWVMCKTKKSKDFDMPIMLSSSGDPYPLQLIPTTMAAAAAATPGLGPLQLQVTSILFVSTCSCVCGDSVHFSQPFKQNLLFSPRFFPLFLFCDPDREQQCPLFSSTLFLMPTASCHRNGSLWGAGAQRENAALLALGCWYCSLWSEGYHRNCF